MALDNSEVGTKEAVINAYYLVLITERSLDFLQGNLENLQRMLHKQTKCLKPEWLKRQMQINSRLQ